MWKASRVKGCEPLQWLLAACFRLLYGTWVEGLLVVDSSGVNLSTFGFALVFLVGRMSWSVWMSTGLFTILYSMSQLLWPNG